MKRGPAVLFAVFLCCIRPAFAKMDWGIALNAMRTSPDISNYEKDFSYLSHKNNFSGQIDSDDYSSGVSLFFERTWNKLGWGIDIGYSRLPSVTYSGSFQPTTGQTAAFVFQQKGFSIPVLITARYSPFERLVLYGGAGATLLSNRIQMTYTNIISGSTSSNTNTFKDTIISPTLSAGAEIRLSKWIAFDIGARYLASANMNSFTSGNKYLTITESGTGSYIGETDLPGLMKFKENVSGINAFAAVKLYFSDYSPKPLPSSK